MPENQQDETILVALHPNNLEEVEPTRKELEVDAEVLTGTKVLIKAHCTMYEGHLAIIDPDRVWYTLVYGPNEFTILAGELEDQDK